MCLCACFVDAGPGATGSGGTGSTTTSAATTGPATTVEGTTVEGTTGAEATGEATATTGATEPMTSTAGTGSIGDASTGAPVDPPCAAYYGTEFGEDPGSDWQVLAPTWEWDEVMGTYRGAPGGGLSAVTKLVVGSWMDVRVQARIRLSTNARGGLLVRLGDPGGGEFLYVELDTETKEIAAYRGDMPQISVGKYEVADVWVDLEVWFVGTTVGFALDGQKIANGIQIEGLAAGAVGLLVQAGKIEVDSLYVCPPR